MIDYLIVAAIVFGLAWGLNAKFYKENPASKTKAWVLTIVLFIVLTVVMTMLMHYRYSMLGITPKKLLDFSSIGLAAIFYWTINKVKKGEFEILTADGGSVATFDSKEKADEYLAKNSDKNYTIKEK